MSPKELAEYAKVCRKHGIKDLQIENVSFSLDLSHDPTPAKPSSEQPQGPETELSEEDILNWSSGAPL